MAKGPYEINYDDFMESKEITDPVSLLKLELGSKFLKITNKMETAEILKITGLHKSDLSRIRAGSLKRFTIDRIIHLLDALGYKAKISMIKDQKAS